MLFHSKEPVLQNSRTVRKIHSSMQIPSILFGTAGASTKFRRRLVPRRIHSDYLAAGHGDLHGPQTFHPVDHGNAFFLGVPVNRDLVPWFKCAVVPSDAPAHDIRRMKFHGPGFDVARSEE